jgi:hypothetical protein
MPQQKKFSELKLVAEALAQLGEFPEPMQLLDDRGEWADGYLVQAHFPEEIPVGDERLQTLSWRCAKACIYLYWLPPVTP